MRFTFLDHWRRYPSTAQDWVVRVQAGDMSRAEQMALDAWLNGSPANAESFCRLNKVGHVGLRMRDHPEAMNQLPGYANWKRRKEAARPTSRRLWFAGGVAAAASLAALVFMPGFTLEPGDAYATARGEQRQVSLADGSRMAMNTDSKVLASFSAVERRIVLEQGEVYFEVVKDAARPFVVSAGASEIRVTGTKFTVRRDRDSTAVTVAEGTVLVAPVSGKPPMELRLGEQVVLSETVARPPTVAKVDADKANAWVGGYLDFEDVPLSTVIAEVNRYAAQPIVLQDESLGSTRLSARFRVGDVEALKFALRDRLGVQAVEDGGRIALRR